MPRDTYDMFSPPERGRFGENEQRERFDKSPPNHGPSQGRWVDITMVWHGESRQAVRVSQNGDLARAIWLPKSLIKIEMLGQPRKDRNGKPARACQITLPEWKAKQSGLI